MNAADDVRFWARWTSGSAERLERRNLTRQQEETCDDLH
jgi:hypothetical protein